MVEIESAHQIFHVFMHISQPPLQLGQDHVTMSGQ